MLFNVLDFNMLIYKPTEAELTDKFRFVHGSRYESMNITKKIESQNDYHQLINELKPMKYADLLRNTFIRHMNADAFDRSGLFLKFFQLYDYIIHTASFLISHLRI